MNANHPQIVNLFQIVSGDLSMEETGRAPRIGVKSLLLLAAGLALMIPLLATFDLKGAIGVLKSIGTFPVLLSFLSIHIGVLFYNLGWYFLLDKKASFRDVFLIGWTSLFINLLIPAGSASGEVARVYFISKKSKIQTGHAISTIVAHRVVMIVPFIVSIVLGLSYLVEYTGVGHSALTAVLVAVALLIIAFYLIYKISMDESRMLKIISFLERRLNRDLSRVREMVNDYSRAFRELMGYKRTLILSLLCAFLNWLFDMLPIFIYLYSMGFWIDPLMGILIYSVSIILVLIPIGIPGNTGIREWVMTGLLSALGFGGKEALAITLVSSTITVFLNELVFGFLAYLLVLKETTS